MEPTSRRLLFAVAFTGACLGWLVKPVARGWGLVAPALGWSQVLSLVVAAAVLVALAWNTHRTLQTPASRLEPQQAVNRLVLAKASALVGALAFGGYAGFALSWIGDASARADERLVRGLVASAAAGAMCVAALAIERACRVKDDDQES